MDSSFDSVDEKVAEAVMALDSSSRVALYKCPRYLVLDTFDQPDWHTILDKELIKCSRSM